MRRLWPALLVAAGCSVDPTQLVVVVATDMSSTELDGFRTSVIDSAGGVHGVHDLVRGTGVGEAELPASFGVAPLHGDASRRVTVSVEGLFRSEPVVETHALTGFVEHEQLRLDLFLARRCLTEAAACTAEETCTNDGCVSEEFPPEELPRWDPDMPLGSDAGASGADGGTPPSQQWVHLFEAPSMLSIADVAAGEDGDVYAAGSFAGILELDGEVVATATGLQDAWVARLDGLTGELVWFLPIVGNSSSQVVPVALAVDPDHGVAIAGYSVGRVIVDGELFGSSSANALVLRLDAADGSVTDVRTFPSTGAARATDVAFAPNGDLDVVGLFENDLDVGAVAGGGLAPAGGPDTGFRLRIGEAAEPTCLVTLQDATPLYSIARLDGWRVAAAGVLRAAIDLGDPELQRQAGGASDLYVAQFDCAVAVDLEVIAGTIAEPRIARAGDVLVATGYAEGALLDPRVDSSPRQHFLTAAIAVDGSLGDAQLGGGEGEAALLSVAPASDASVVAGGYVGGPAEIAGEVLDRAQGIVVQIDTSGRVTWARGFPAEVMAVVRAVAAMPDGGAVIVSGTTTSPMTFAGLGEVAPRDGNDGVFIHSFVPGP